VAETSSAVVGSMSKVSEADHEPEPQPVPQPEVEDGVMEDNEDIDDTSYFPESSRFGTPRQHSSPMKQEIGRNPLEHLLGSYISNGTGLSLSQVFDAASSPVAVRARVGSSQPPTPSVTATALMARSMPTDPRSQKEYSSPDTPQKGISPVFRHCVRSRRMGKESPLKHICPESVESSPVRSRSAPDVVSSSPPVLKKSVQRPSSDSDEDPFFSESEDIKRRADARRKEGEEQLRQCFRAQSTGDLKDAPRKQKKKNPRKQSTGRPVRKQPAREQKARPNVRKASDGDETADENGESQDAAVPAKGQRRATKTASGLPEKITETQVPASDPINEPGPQSRAVDLDEIWDRLHSGPALRPSLSYSVTGQKSRSGGLQPNAPTPERLHPKVTGTISNPASILQMVPFNIPSLPPTPPGQNDEAGSKTGTDFVRESSNLLPPTQALHSSLTPNPSSPPRDAQKSSPLPRVRGHTDGPVTPSGEKSVLLENNSGSTTVPDTSPSRREGRLGSESVPQASKFPPDLGPLPALAQESPTRKRKFTNGGNERGPMDPPKPPNRLKSFESLNNSQTLLSSQESPDEVDMIDIFSHVGVGNDHGLQVPSPTKGGPKKRRKTSAKRGAPVEALRQAEPEPEPLSMPVPKDTACLIPPELPPPELPPPLPPKPKNTPAVKAKSKLAKAPVTSAKPLARKVSKLEIKKTTRTPMRYSSTALLESSIHAASEMDNSCSDMLVHNSSLSLAAEPHTPVVAHQRVFALFKDAKLQYHPATILYRYNAHNRATVAFDDGTEDVLECECVRSLDLRLGDIVKVDLPNMRKLAWVIMGFPEAQPPDIALAQTLGNENASPPTDVRGRSTIVVVPRKSSSSSGSSSAPTEVPVTKIYLTKSLWSQFASRDTTSAVTILPLSVPRTLSPATTRRTTPLPMTTTTPRKSGIFTNMLFALSFGPAESAKRQLESQIVTHGGKILKIGFEELFLPFSEHPSPSTSLTLKPEHEQHARFAAVIANSHSRRAKFLQALALGIPCLAGRWVEDCILRRKVVEWEYYLLPAGESSYLGGVVRSRVLAPYDAATARLADVVAGRRGKWLQGETVVFVSKAAAAEKCEAFTFLAFVVGAVAVVRVRSVEQGRGKGSVLLVEKGEREKVKGWKGRVMDEEDVVQGIIAGKLMD
jgi:hypothetical protein